MNSFLYHNYLHISFASLIIPVSFPRSFRLRLLKPSYIVEPSIGQNQLVLNTAETGVLLKYIHHVICHPEA